MTKETMHEAEWCSITRRLAAQSFTAAGDVLTQVAMLTIADDLRGPSSSATPFVSKALPRKVRRNKAVATWRR
jgi:hypothetical protein